MTSESTIENTAQEPSITPEVSPGTDAGVRTDILATPELVEVVDTRLAILMKIDALSRDRESMLSSPDLPGDAKSELNRQVRELKKFPTLNEIAESRTQLENRISVMREAAIVGNGPPVSQALQKAKEMAIRQWQLLGLWNELTPSLLDISAKLVEQEPLYAVLSRSEGSARALFGWAVYAAAVEAMRKRVTAQRTMLQARIDQARKEDDQATLKACLGNLDILLSATIRELHTIERTMVEAFWSAYSEASVLLAEGAVPVENQPVVRAFLRYGMIGSAPWLIDPSLAQKLLDDCRQFIERLDESPDATHVLYADEYIDLVARGRITPSIDEDLELNHRGSDAWLRDKSWRRMIASRNRLQALNHTVSQLQVRIGKLQELNANLERQLAGMTRESALRASLREKVQNNRVEATRRALAIKQIQENLIPEEETRGKSAETKLMESGGAFSIGELARQEVDRIHRICRLCAKLKDPFPPCSLRDNFRPERWNIRAAVLTEVREIEECDPTVFKEVAVFAKQAEHRTYIRQSPYVLLAPCMGFLSYAWNPRSAAESGRLVVPLHTPRAGILKMLMHALVADFRWDTSKESAGLDLLTSDTLVAAYSTVRWDYRKRQKEARLKAGIYSHESDRKNWRHHYMLYLTSAKDGGRKLFFRCQEIYDIVVRYLGLPEGVRKLRR